MIFLILSMLCSTAIFIIFKVFDKYKIDNLQAIIVNYIIAAGFGFLTYSGNISPLEVINEPFFPLALILGFLFITVFLIFSLSSQKVGITITAVSSKMSVVIPVIFAVVLYSNTINYLKATGIILALIAFYLTLRKEKHVKIKKIYILLPILLFIGNGMNDTLLNYYQQKYIIDNNQVTLYISIIFVIALSIGIVVQLYRYFINHDKIELKNFVAGIILGIFNYGSTYYFMKSLGVLQGTVVFPMLNAGIVTLSTITGFLIFKERLKPINWIGILLAIFAIIIIAIA